MRTLPFLCLLLLLAACTTPQHEDSWRYEAAAATKAYGEYFLKEEWAMIESEAITAERHAKQSGDLMPLARFHLSRCALHHAVLMEDACSDYRETAEAERFPELDAYYAMLQKQLKTSQISDLPYRYRRFARTWMKRDSAGVSDAIRTMTPLQSKMVAASLAPEALDEPLIESIIDEASHLGYRRAVIAWMTYLKGVTSDGAKREQLQKKLDLLAK